MREIKFRAWNKLPGYSRMTYDGFSVSASGDPVGYFLEPGVTPNTTRVCGEWRGDSTIVLMQYTGLKDKNGKEVYESDIVIGIYNKIGIIQYYALTPRSGFGIQYWDKDSLRWSDEIGLEFEVIGNIYENPELLETK